MHLNDVPELSGGHHERWRSRLFDLNIRHVEQLGSLLAAPEGRYALERLDVPLDEVQAVLEPVLKERLGLSLEHPLKANGMRSPLLTRKRHSMGHVGGDRLREVAFDSELPPPSKSAAAASASAAALASSLPPEIILGPPASLPAFDQGRRGTCVAFTAMAMYQGMLVRDLRQPVRLSVQYLYYRAKLECPHGPDEEGTSLDVALQILRREGCCLEEQLDYVPRHDFPQRYLVHGHSPRTPLSDLKRLARQQRVPGIREVTKNVAAIKAELAQLKPVGVGVAVYQLAWYNALARSRGEIILPPMVFGSESTTILDTFLGGHAVALVGYRDGSQEDEDSQRPGGGYFIFRNSWGGDWAPQNSEARGYGYLPYAYVDRFLLEAAVIDDLAPAKVRGQTTKSPRAPRTTGRSKVAAPAPPKKPRARRKQPPRAKPP